MLDLDLFITIGIVSSTFYDKQHDFNYEIVTFPFLVLAMFLAPLLMVYMRISQLICFVRICSNVSDINSRNCF